MARPESTAVAGYYPTPEHLLPRIAKLVSPTTAHEVTYLDPCAGEGTAIFALAKAWQRVKVEASLYACEMEQTRFAALKTAAKQLPWAMQRNLLHCDAFHVTYEKGYRQGVSVLYLNPPYDFDREHGRLEHKFLQRFTGALTTRGVLFFVVPHYALAASAEYLATHYENLHCFRFPRQDFESFKQVVLVAQRRDDGLAPNPRLLKLVEGYARNPEALPELPTEDFNPIATVPTTEKHAVGLNKWERREVDIAGLQAKAKAWMQTGRGGVLVPVRGVLPDQPVQELLLRQYPVATPPRPAHIAAGIASGIFNGARVEPSDKRLPPLLVKGVFTQEYRTIESRVSKDGDVSYVQVQQPKLVVTALDLKTHQYHTLQTHNDTTPSIESLSIAGLMKHYERGLMEVMEAQCPILYDPRYHAESIKLAEVAREPFSAQAHASRAIISLLGGPSARRFERKGKAAILLGEVGSGKTGVALTVGKTIGARRPLVMCPPHLLSSWQHEIAAVLPEARTRVLATIADVEAAAQDGFEGTVISILSREAAKLSHGYDAVGVTCPKCGGLTPSGDLAKTRARCQREPLVARGSRARLAMTLAWRLAKYAPQDETIGFLLESRWPRRVLAHYQAQEVLSEFRGLEADFFASAVDSLLKAKDAADNTTWSALVRLLVAAYNPELIAKVAEHFLSKEGWAEAQFGRELLLMLPPQGEAQQGLVEKYRTATHSYYNPWEGVEKVLAEGAGRVAAVEMKWSNGALLVEDEPAGSLKTALAGLRALASRGGFARGAECGEYLYHAVPEPRRVALAKYITQRHPRAFDFFVLDESHEAGSGDSAQSQAAQRLAGLGLPMIFMTGSIMNGYAESFFTAMLMASPAFRQEFKRGDKQRFIDRYGYRKRIVTEKEDKKATLAFGANSDRIIRSERIVGSAPGVLPLFLLKHLLPIAVTLHKADLAVDLPKCVQERHLVEPSKELLKRYTALQNALLNRIKKDQFTPNLAGKLFGQLAELPSYLDRSTEDTGNCDTGAFEIRYPESVGGDLVAGQVPFAAKHISAKEQWLLDRVKSELAEGRNVLVFSWHVSLLPRYAQLLSDATGSKVPILNADKVPTGKRQEWIQKNVIAKRARVMCVNPVAVSTGLNVLTHFSTEIFMENPAVNPILCRQAIGRVDRIGQRHETRILFPVYAGTLQETLHDLLLQKIAVSTAADGLDPESALASVGLSEDPMLSGMSIGRQLWQLLSEQETPKKRKATV